MNREEQYYKSVSALVKGFFNDTLEPMSCMACAVGNIMAEFNGARVLKRGSMFMWDEGYPVWHDYKKNGTCIMSNNFAGYTPREIKSIEEAFMWGQGVNCESDKYSIFQALMDTVDELGRIHEVDQKQVEESKKLFVTTD